MSIDSAPRALVDMDGVLVRPDIAVDAEMTRRFPDVTPLAGHPNFYVAHDYPPEYRPQVWGIMHEPGFFYNLPLEVGALEGLERIIRAGFRPQICSSPIRRIAEACTAEKLDWVETHLVPALGKWIRDEAVITSHKHEVQGAALLDDRPALRSAGLASWRHVLFVPSGTSYGKDVDTPFKLHGWGDPMLETILAHCVRRPMPRVGTPVKL